MSGITPKSEDMVSGYIFHDEDHSEWMVLGTEWDAFTGGEVYRIVQLAKGEAHVLTDESGERLTQMPFTGRAARLYPKTVTRFHIKETP